MRRTICFTEKNWHKPSKHVLNSLPLTAFLDPIRRKYPIMKTPSGPIYVFALTASTAFAIATNEMSFYLKAKKLLEIYHELKKYEFRCIPWDIYYDIWRSI